MDLKTIPYSVITLLVMWVSSVAVFLTTIFTLYQHNLTALPPPSIYKCEQLNACMQQMEEDDQQVHTKVAGSAIIKLCFWKRVLNVNVSASDMDRDSNNRKPDNQSMLLVCKLKRTAAENTD